MRPLVPAPGFHGQACPPCCEGACSWEGDRGPKYPRLCVKGDGSFQSLFTRQRNRRLLSAVCGRLGSTPRERAFSTRGGRPLVVTLARGCTHAGPGVRPAACREVQGCECEIPILTGQLPQALGTPPVPLSLCLPCGSPGPDSQRPLTSGGLTWCSRLCLRPSQPRSVPSILVGGCQHPCWTLRGCRTGSGLVPCSALYLGRRGHGVGVHCSWADRKF